MVTPGTVSEPGLLPGDGNNYLACVVLADAESRAGQAGETINRAGIAYVDITTGEFSAKEMADQDIHAVVRAELSRLKPAELLHPEGSLRTDSVPGHLTAWPAWRFEFARCQEELLRHFKSAPLDGFGLHGMGLAVSAAGAIVQYLDQTQSSALH